MKTLFAIIALIIFGIITNFVSVFIINFAGLPGALLAGKPGVRSKFQFVFGSIISAIGQSYIYLAYTAFIVNWTLRAARREDIVGFILWPFAFLAVMKPIWTNLFHARQEAREQQYSNPQVEGLHLTFFITLLAFFIFIFVPSIMNYAWRWVPYVR